MRRLGYAPVGMRMEDASTLSVESHGSSPFVRITFDDHIRDPVSIRAGNLSEQTLTSMIIENVPPVCPEMVRKPIERRLERERVARCEELRKNFNSPLVIPPDYKAPPGPPPLKATMEREGGIDNFEFEGLELVPDSPRVKRRKSRQHSRSVECHNPVFME